MASREHVVALPEEIASKSLSREQEKQLSEIILSGKDEDFKARNELIESNLRLVRAIAKDYTGQGMSMNELISSGQIGLMVAAVKFDGRYPAKFSSFAQWWIRRSIREDLLRHSCPLTVSASTIRRARRMSAVSIAFEVVNGRTPTHEELASAAKETVRRVRCTADLCQTTFVSLEKNLEHGHAVADEPSERIGDPDTIRKLRICLKKLTEKEKEVVANRFGLNGCRQTLKDIGRKLRISSERVRQIEEATVEKLRGMMEGTP